MAGLQLSPTTFKTFVGNCLAIHGYNRMSGLCMGLVFHKIKAACVHNNLFCFKKYGRLDNKLTHCIKENTAARIQDLAQDRLLA